MPATIHDLSDDLQARILDHCDLPTLLTVSTLREFPISIKAGGIFRRKLTMWKVTVVQIRRKRDSMSISITGDTWNGGYWWNLFALPLGDVVELLGDLQKIIVKTDSFSNEGKFPKDSTISQLEITLTGKYDERELRTAIGNLFPSTLRLESTNVKFTDEIFKTKVVRDTLILPSGCFQPCAYPNLIELECKIVFCSLEISIATEIAELRIGTNFEIDLQPLHFISTQLRSKHLVRDLVENYGEWAPNTVRIKHGGEEGDWTVTYDVTYAPDLPFSAIRMTERRKAFCDEFGSLLIEGVANDQM